jgi:hypothetical protein
MFPALKLRIPERSNIFSCLFVFYNYFCNYYRSYSVTENQILVYLVLEEQQLTEG